MGKQYRETARLAISFETLEDRRVLAPIVVQNTMDSGNGSLRNAILAANQAAGRDEIVFSSSLFAGGVTPVIRLQTPLTITTPVWIHSPPTSGGVSQDVQFEAQSSYNPEEAFLIQPSLNGTGQNIDIGDAIIDGFQYGIKATAGNGASSISEALIIENSRFVSNHRAILVQDALYHFEFNSNAIVGLGGTGPGTDAGIWIESSTHKRIRLRQSSTETSLVLTTATASSSMMRIYRT